VETLRSQEGSGIKCLMLVPHEPEYETLWKSLIQVASAEGVQVIGSVPPSEPSLFFEDIVQADLVVADLSAGNVRIFYEIGVAQAIGKATVFLLDQAASLRSFEVAAGVIVGYAKTPQGFQELRRSFRRVLVDFKKTPRRFIPMTGTLSRLQQPTVLSDDIERLGPREFENLCFELLTQMGFRRVEWGKEFREIDAVAVFPRKDPDGFQYEELWLISMGLHAPFGMLLEMASDPEYLHHRFIRGEDPSDRAALMRSGAPLTLLLVPFPHGGSVESLQREVQRLERRYRERPSRTLLRLRVWDTQHLVSLIQQFPQLVYKYFSEQGRAQSKYRKSAEEMYRENVALSERLQGTIAALEEEKDKRIRAERDAVWKELSFTAAHKLGNPVFALETDLQSLKKRLGGAFPDAREVTEEMRASLERAKIIIEQFKSLTKAQEISPRPIDIVPLIKCATRVAEQGGAKVTLQASENVPKIMADPGRIAECFDELVANAMHWFDKQSKEITVVVERKKKRDLPEALDHSKRYLEIRFADNGCGVPLENKEKVFRPFFTTHPHGTGLGLALVERIVEGHGGLIRETGKPAKDAVFEIYLPIADKT
jgi:signal transduction histidine kinase